jgi:hypothetical protein
MPLYRLMVLVLATIAATGTVYQTDHPLVAWLVVIACACLGVTGAWWHDRNKP